MPFIRYNFVPEVLLMSAPPTLPSGPDLPRSQSVPHTGTTLNPAPDGTQSNTSAPSTGGAGPSRHPPTELPSPPMEDLQYQEHSEACRAIRRLLDALHANQRESGPPATLLPTATRVVVAWRAAMTARMARFVTELRDGAVDLLREVGLIAPKVDPPEACSLELAACLKEEGAEGDKARRSLHTQLVAIIECADRDLRETERGAQPRPVQTLGGTSAWASATAGATTQHTAPTGATHESFISWLAQQGAEHAPVSQPHLPATLTLPEARQLMQPPRAPTAVPNRAAAPSRAAHSGAAGTLGAGGPVGAGGGDPASSQTGAAQARGGAPQAGAYGTAGPAPGPSAAAAAAAAAEAAAAAAGAATGEQAAPAAPGAVPLPADRQALRAVRLHTLIPNLLRGTATADASMSLVHEDGHLRLKKEDTKIRYLTLVQYLAATDAAHLYYYADRPDHQQFVRHIVSLWDSYPNRRLQDYDLAVRDKVAQQPALSFMGDHQLEWHIHVAGPMLAAAAPSPQVAQPAPGRQRPYNEVARGCGWERPQQRQRGNPPLTWRREQQQGGGGAGHGGPPPLKSICRHFARGNCNNSQRTEGCTRQHYCVACNSPASKKASGCKKGCITIDQLPQ